MLTRWCLIAAVLYWFGTPAALAQAAPAAASNIRTITVIGDSLSAEYGLERGSGWVMLLGQKLQAKYKNYQVKNTSISGDTTSGGLSRLAPILKRDKPAIVIIELGSNDALRGLPLKMTESNLSSMIELSQKAGARVLLLGMQMPPNYGRQYTSQFKELFAALAARYRTGLVPFLLEGIATDPSRFQADHLHPNEGAQAQLANNVWAGLQPLLKP
ncbi:arylesterase [Paralcaligenes sp. KSB-10]|uniref:arylesterase n=1 Tax=Paralcaligenes sp. KSB-10 TaxID=2901142 RepID=UPI001E522685|nr:arylesterase [Paralcaligenes sp. KSB-10]UHL64932.1 arylesterase [Paralcaligenes sp. KSB-10]